MLEVSLRNAGYNVAGCPSVGKAFEILHASKPDLILSDTTFADMNGFEFVEQLRQNSDWSEIPFMFLSSDGSIESKIRGLELGVEDYLTKPIYIREVVARVGIELARQTRAGLARRNADSRTRFSGSLSEMSVVDLLQTIDVSRKSGVLTLVSADGQEGMISFDSGAVINASVEDLHGEEAVYRHLLWREGTFDLEFRRVSLSERTVHRTTQALLMEGMRRLDEWSRLLELLPSFDAVLEVDAEVLRERLKDLPDEQNAMIRLVDGRRTVGEILLQNGGDHVDGLRKVVDLYFEGLVCEAGRNQESIPVLTEVSRLTSAPPPRQGVHTIPGPAGAPLPQMPVPAAPRAPRLDETPTSETAREIDAVLVAAELFDSASGLERGVDSVPRDRRSTPVSLPAPRVESMDASEEIITPSERPASHGTPGGAAAETALGWKPAPPPQRVMEARSKTPKGFQAVHPEKPAHAGGTILSWAGRAADIERIEEISARETAEIGRWDRTLQELRDDPEVEEAIEAIDSDPPPAPFVRSEPPSARSSDEAMARDEEDHGDAALEALAYHEPPEVDPPPLTYAQVFEETSTPALEERLQGAQPGATAPIDSREPTRLRRALLVLAIGCAIAAVAYWRSMLVPETVSGVEAAPTVEPARATEPPPAEPLSASPPEPAAESPSAPASAPEAAPMPDPEQTPAAPPVNAETGAPDTYEAQLALARRLKRGPRATAAYRRAIELNPESSSALAELARLMLARRHAREAAELAERATAVDPTNALGWVTLGAARQMRGDRQGATQAYQSCVKLGRGEYVRECRAMLR